MIAKIAVVGILLWLLASMFVFAYTLGDML